MENDINKDITCDVCLSGENHYKDLIIICNFCNAATH